MNTPKTPDPLDNKINDLLVSQPLEPGPEFIDRVLTATEQLAFEENTPRTLYRWVRLTLPLAAMFVAAFALLQVLPNKPSEANRDVPEISIIELQEIFMLEEGLSDLADLQNGDLDDINLLDALTFFNLEA